MIEPTLKTKLQNKTMEALLGRLPTVIEAQCQTAAGRGQDKMTFLAQDLDSFIAMLGEIGQARFKGLRASKGGTLVDTDLDELMKPILSALASSTDLKIQALASSFAKQQNNAHIAFILDWS